MADASSDVERCPGTRRRSAALTAANAVLTIKRVPRGVAGRGTSTNSRVFAGVMTIAFILGLIEGAADAAGHGRLLAPTAALIR